MIKIFKEKDYVSEVRDSIHRSRLIFIGENVCKVLDKVNYPKDMVDNVKFEFDINYEDYITYSFNNGNIIFKFDGVGRSSVTFSIRVFSFLGFLFVGKMKGVYEELFYEFKIKRSEFKNNELYETMKELNKLRYELAAALVNDNRNLFDKKIKRAVDRYKRGIR